MSAPTLAAIRVYPLKGGRGMTPRSWPVDDFGPAFDRRWMVVRSDGTFLTQRTHPRLALVESSVDPGSEDGTLTLAAPGMEPLEVSGPGARGAPVRTRVWGAPTEGVDCGDGPAAWISDHLGEEARVIFMPDGVRRPVDPAHASGARVSFADGFPFLLLTLASMDELNRRLAKPIPADRFRPNLLVDGTEPHAEDRWRRVRIGELELRVVKPCARCVVTTVDQKTARKGGEPLETLARYRRSGGGVYFGQNAVHDGPGRLRVGQGLEVLDTGPPRPGL